jgi:hypothetical protein
MAAQVRRAPPAICEIEHRREPSGLVSGPENSARDEIESTRAQSNQEFVMRGFNRTTMCVSLIRPPFAGEPRMFAVR